MSNVPGSGTPGSNVAGAVGGASTPGITPSSNPPSSNPSPPSIPSSNSSEPEKPQQLSSEQLQTKQQIDAYNQAMTDYNTKESQYQQSLTNYNQTHEQLKQAYQQAQAKVTSIPEVISSSVQNIGGYPGPQILETLYTIGYRDTSTGVTKIAAQNVNAAALAALQKQATDYDTAAEQARQALSSFENQSSPPTEPTKPTPLTDVFARQVTDYLNPYPTRVVKTYVDYGNDLQKPVPNYLADVILNTGEEKVIPNPNVTQAQKQIAESFASLPAGARQYGAYVLDSNGQFRETGTGNEYKDALVKASDINLKIDIGQELGSLGAAQGVQSYIAQLVNQIAAFGKPVTYDNGGGPVSFNYNQGTRTIEVRGTNVLAQAKENANSPGLPNGGLSGGGPETPQSAAYEKAGISFGQNAVSSKPQLSRNIDDTISEQTKDIAASLAQQDVISGVAIKGDTYGGLAQFGGEGSTNPIEKPTQEVNPNKQSKTIFTQPGGGLVQVKPISETINQPEIIPTFENVLTNKETKSGINPQVPFEKLDPGLQSLVSGGLGGNETTVGGIQEFLKTHDYSKLTGQLPTEEIKQNNLVPGISIEEQQSQALGAGLASLSEQQQLAKYQSNALGVGLLSLSQEQQISKAQSQGLGAALMDISNQQKEQKIITSNQLSEQQSINAKVNNAIDRLAFEGDLITSAKNAGAKTIDIFGVETDLGSVFPAKGKTVSSFDVFSAESTKLIPLESIPVSKANELLPSILNKYKGKEIQLGYTPAPIASPGPAATLETKIDPIESLVGTPLSNIIRPAEALTNFVINTGLGLEALGVSLGERITEANVFSPNPLNLKGMDILTDKQKAYLNTNPVPGIDIVKGAEEALQGKGTSGFVTGLGPSYDIPYLAATGASLLIGSGITKIPSLIKSGIGIQAVKGALETSNPLPIKGELNQAGEASAETSIVKTDLRNLPTYKNLNMMRTPVPKDVFALDVAEITSVSSRQISPVNLTLENTSKEISQLSKIQNDLLKAEDINKSQNKTIGEDVFYINKVPMSSLGATNQISNNVSKVNVDNLLPNGIIAPEEQASGITPLGDITKKASISQTSSISGNVPGSGTPGSNVAGAVGGASGLGIPDIFQAPRASRIEFERRMSERENPDLYESDFVPTSNDIIPLSLRSTEIGQRLEALDLFKRGLAVKQNPTYYQREGVPKELMGKFSKMVSNQTTGSRPEIFGQNKEVKLKLEDMEYNPADNFKPTPRTGKSPFDIQFGETPLYSNQEFTSDFLSPEEQALAERYPLMKNTLPPKQKLFTEPRSIPETGKAPIQKETFDIAEIYKGREEAKFFGTFELKTNFEEIGYVPIKENPIFFKGTEAGQRIEALDLFKTGIRAKLNPDYYERIGVPKELMGKFSKQVSEQTTGNKLPEIFGETEKNIVKESNLDAFYSPNQNIRQFFERLESNNGIGKNKTKINTDKVLGIDNEPPTIGEVKERLSVIEQAGLKRTERENKLIKPSKANIEDILLNARRFFENEKQMFSETKISLGVGEGKLIPKGGGLASILKNFGKPSNPTAKTEEPKPRETRTENGLIQILKEQPQTSTPFKEYPLPLGEGLVKLPKKTKKITEGLTSLSSLSIQAQEQLQNQSSGLTFKPLQSFKQAQDLLYKPAQKQGQPQAFKFMQVQEESPAVAQLYKPLQAQEQTPKLKQMTKQLETNPFEVPPPQKQFQLEATPNPVKVPTEQPPKLPPGGIFDDNKRKHPKKKKEKAELANFLGNAPEFDIVGIYKRQEIVYGNSTIARLTSQDTSNMNKKYAEKTKIGKDKTLFTEGNKSIKVKGSTAKPKSFQEKFKKKIKI